MEDELSLYHGSNQVIKDPEFNYGSKDKDFGPGFYCTENLEMAKDYACRGDFMNFPTRFVNQYSLNTKDLKMLEFKDDKDSILKWVALVLKKRKIIIPELWSFNKNVIIKNFLPDISDVDLIKGYPCDNRYFFFIKDFTKGCHSFEFFRSRMKMVKYEKQIVLVSKKAFEKIKFIRFEKVQWKDYHYAGIKNERAKLAFDYSIHPNKDGTTKWVKHEDIHDVINQLAKENKL